MRTLVVEARALLTAESATAGGGASVASLLGDTHWPKQPIVRLALVLLYREARRGGGYAIVRHVLEGTHRRLWGEKASKDVRQHVRDLSRARRAKHVSLNAAYGAAQYAGVLEARRVRIPDISLKNVAILSWNTFAKTEKLGHTPVTLVLSLSVKFREALQPERSWPSPATPTQLRAADSWGWLLQVAKSPVGHNGYEDSWRSRFADPLNLHVYVGRDIACVPLTVAASGFCCVRMERVMVDG